MIRKILISWAILSLGYAAYAESLPYPARDLALREWRPGRATPPVVLAKTHAAGSLVFPIPLLRFGQRLYWDHDLSANLSTFNSFELDLSVENPETIDTIFVYFRSRNGWYVWGGAVREIRAGKLVLVKEDFKVEEHPSGWDKVDLVRIAVNSKLLTKGELRLHGFRAVNAPVLIVQGSASIDDGKERKSVARVAQRLSAWLKEMEIPHGWTKDEQLSAQALRGVHSIIMLGHQHVPEAELASISGFLSHGGKVMVMGSADPNLARLLGVKLEPFYETKESIPWKGWAFSSVDGWPLPQRVYQEARGACPARPTESDGVVIASWLDGEGNPTRYPAWLATEHGLWGTHLLTADDFLNKQQMLFAFFGWLDPTLWPQIARHCYARAGRIASYNDLGESCAAIKNRASGSGRAGEVNELVAKVKETYYPALAKAYREGSFPQCCQLSFSIRQLLTDAYALVQLPRGKEFVGVWDHTGLGLYPGDWDRTCAALSKLGVTAIFPNLVWGGVAHYDSAILPKSKTFYQYGDQLAECVRAAHKYGIEVHVWKICWNLGDAPGDWVKELVRQQRLQMTAAGQTIYWLSPALQANRQLELAVCKEIVERYDVDGLHFDYIRFPDAVTDYSFAAQRGFEQWKQCSVVWPQDVRDGGCYHQEFQQWRALQITEHVACVSKEIKKLRPNVKLSAAVYGAYPESVGRVGQDWGSWLKYGLVDFVCPMDYTDNMPYFVDLVNRQRQLAASTSHIYPGIGVIAGESQLTPDKAVEQVACLRQLGINGYVLFQLRPMLTEQTLPNLVH